MAEKSRQDLKLMDEYKKAKAAGTEKQFLKTHPKFQASLKDIKNPPAKPVDPDAPPATKKGITDPKQLEKWNEYQAAVKRGDGDKFLAKHPGFAKNLNTLGYKEPSSVDKSITATDEIIKAGTTYGKTLADDLLPTGSFGTMDEGTTPAMQDALNKMKDLAATAGDLTADEKAGLAALNDATKTAPEVAEALDSLKRFRDEAGNLTDLEKESLDTMRSGLAGYEGPEVQAMREQAMRQIGRQYSGQIRQLENQQARQGIRGGGASFAQQQDLRAMQRGDVAAMETDLVAKQADEVQRRRESFANLASATEAARTGRQVSSQDLYNRSLGTEHQRLTNAAANYGAQATTTANAATNRGLAANQLYGGMLSAEEAAQRGIQGFNIGQRTDEALARAGVVTGGIGAYTGIQSGQYSADRASEQFAKLAAMDRNKTKQMLADADKARKHEWDILREQITAFKF